MVIQFCTHVLPNQQVVYTSLDQAFLLRVGHSCLHQKRLSTASFLWVEKNNPILPLPPQSPPKKNKKQRGYKCPIEIKETKIYSIHYKTN